MKNTFLSIVLLLTFSCSFAQQDSLKWRLAQVSFFYPLGTNGTAVDYTNILSFNILAGVNGGLRGAEFGIIANINTGDVYGFQASGVVNVNAANMGGVQTASVLNANLGDVYAGQFANVANINRGNFTGVSASTININGKNTYGAQLSAVLNLSVQNTDGAQISGFMNITGDTLNGTQIGIINKARVLNGTQIGIINIVSDTSENAVPIGLFNYTPDGVAEVELAATEVIYGNLNLKFGSRRLYTILKAGFSIQNTRPLTAFGLGLGSRFQLGNNLSLAAELESSQLNTGYYWRVRDIDLLSSANLTLRYRLNNNLAVSAGPVYNSYLTQDISESAFGNLNPPYLLYSEIWPDIEIYHWIGGKIGISFTF
jgi:hypothetical protein